MPAISTNFADLLDPRMKKVYNESYKQLPDRVAEFYAMPETGDFPAGNEARFSEVGGFGNIPEFTGTLVYQDVSQGYDKIATHKEYASGFQVERKLFDDGRFDVIDGKPRNLALALQRTRQTFAASPFNNAFTVDSTWMNNTEGVALCSNSHTTTDTNASTTEGFDNLVTTALTATNLTAARIQMRKHRDIRGNRISVSPTRILIPIDLYDAAFEITQSQGKPGTAQNDANVHFGVYSVRDWEYFTDTNNWFLTDEVLMKSQGLVWLDRVTSEFGMVEDFDTFNGKWRLYARLSLGAIDWRWLTGAQVS